MTTNDATEQAYKNGYSKGYADGVKEFAETISEIFPINAEHGVISRFLVKTIVKGLAGKDDEPPKGE